MPPTDAQLRDNAPVWCVFYGLGIVGCLGVYGLLQERVMTMPYGNEYFTVSVFLVLMNRVLAMLYSAAMIGMKGESIQNEAPMWKYLAISFSNVIASVCQYEALRYVAFPVQMLGKSFKMCPVMVWGVLIASKRYTAMDWLLAVMVTTGVTQFLISGDIEASHSSGNSGWGLLLLLIFLTLDGFTSTFQEKLFKEHRTSKYNQMLYVNLGSAVVSLVALLTTGQLFTAIGFCSKHPVFVADALALSTSAVASQWFIYSQVKEFGALVFAVSMNARQVVSILLSYIAYGHHISLAQTMGLFLVFAAVFYKTYLASRASPAEKAPLVIKAPEDAEKVSSGK